MPPSTLNMEKLSDAIASGIVTGTNKVVADIAESRAARHDLRGVVQQNTDKTYELDGEVKLLKGMMTSLIGTGDGSTGMVPRLERDMANLGKDMASIKSEMGDVKSDISGIKDDVKAILTKQTSQTSWIDGWRGVGVALGIISACITVVGGIVAALWWLYQHGGVH